MGAQVKDISSDVHKLAYQLHPAKLDQLGLVAAARSLCRDLARQSGIEIEFATEGVPDGIPPQLALCCYRVLQESLGNIVRHSGARAARVELRVEGSQLLLVVSDSGKGFDVEAAREASGLGLISMNERVRLMNGKFEIRSAPGKGTRVELRLPLPATLGASATAEEHEVENTDKSNAAKLESKMRV
jgi:signal transduction histidine kinase